MSNDPIADALAASEAAAAAARTPPPRKIAVEDPRARAAKRAEELREHLGDLDQGSDEFYVDPKVIPPGWDYEWKRVSILGQEDPSYATQIARAGWEPVPVSRHIDMMPTNHKGTTIDRKGCRLMERPKEITDEVRNIEHRRAREQVRQKEAQLAGAPAGTFDRPLAQVKKSYGPIDIPD